MLDSPEGVCAPMWSGLVKGREGSAPLEGCGLAGFLCRRWWPGRSRGARWSARWTNDLARRRGPAQDHGTRRPGQRFGDGSHAPIRARVWGPHDGESGPGLLSQRRRPCCRLMRKRERARY
jgi:hypothetical protein